MDFEMLKFSTDDRKKFYDMVEILISDDFEVVVFMENNSYCLKAIRPDLIGTRFELVDWDRVRMIEEEL